MTDPQLCHICTGIIDGMDHRLKFQKANGSVEGRYDYAKLKLCDECWDLHVEFLYQQYTGTK